MAGLLRSRRFLRALTWVSALVLVAGVVAFATVRLGGNGSEAASTTPRETLPEELPVPPQPKLESVPRAARVVAGEFILFAAGRENLAKAWKITHPDLKRQCGCTYKEWLTGNIPVQPYPVGNLDIAPFAVDELKPNRVVLRVALLPKEGSDVRSQAFFIGLKAVGNGKSRRWLVDYWAPIAVIPVPAAGDQ